MLAIAVVFLILALFAVGYGALALLIHWLGGEEEAALKLSMFIFFWGLIGLAYEVLR